MNNHPEMTVADRAGGKPCLLSWISFSLIFSALLSLLAAGCGSTPGPTSSATQATTASAANPETTDKANPLAETARGIPSNKLRISLTRSPRAGDASNADKLEYEWLMLTSVRTSEAKLNNIIPSSLEPGDKPGPLVMRLSLVYEIESTTPAQPGKMFIKQKSVLSRKIDLPNVGGADGTAATYGAPGVGFIIDKNAMIFDMSFTATQKPDLTKPNSSFLEVDKTTLDKIIKPMLVEEKTIHLPGKISLLEIGANTVTLQIDK
jgi:hypothetical protein